MFGRMNLNEATVILIGNAILIFIMLFYFCEKHLTIAKEKNTLQKLKLLFSYSPVLNFV